MKKYQTVLAKTLCGVFLLATFVAMPANAAKESASFSYKKNTAEMSTKKSVASTSGKSSGKVSTRVNINTAKAEDIASALVGIGLKKAEAIVAWRKSHGKFKTVEQLLKIKGIGEKTLSKNKARIVI